MTLPAPWLDALLTWLHLLAVLSWTVFMTSCTALLRPDWLNAAALARLRVVQRIAVIAGVAVLATGLARMGLGSRGPVWTGMQPLLWVKLAGASAMLAAFWHAGAVLGGWRRALKAAGALPPAAEVDALRKRLLRAAHGVLALAALGVLLSRGLLTW